MWGDGGANRQYPDIDRRIRDTYVKEGTAQKTHQYDMYKRFIRWASDRLADDGIIAFVTNRAYLDARQDDGFRKVAADEFTGIYVLDLGSDVRRNPKISGTTHNVFGIQTGVAIGFFVRDNARRSERSIHFVSREDAEVAVDKLAYMRRAMLDHIGFEDISPDSGNNWLNQANSGFANLLPIADRQTKFANANDAEQAVFGLFTNAVKSNRDDWVFDLDVRNLRNKALFFADAYNEFLDNNDKSYDPVIKWSRDLRNEFQRGRRIVYSEANRIQSLYRPFVAKHHFADFTMNDVLTKNHYEVFGSDLRKPNEVINFCVNGKAFYALAANKPSDFHFTGDTQCLPLYRYTPQGERVSNITEWGLRLINDHYRKEWGENFDAAYREGITAEDIFAYTYAVLHDPVYRHDYAVDLLREFPRLPLYRDFDVWARMGQELLDLHIGFESAEPYNLRRVDQDGPAGRPILRAKKKRGAIVLDSKTTLTGVPSDAWRYRLGSRSALEWVLDQYKEKKPRDPTIAEKFNTYRFADHKERVIDLLQRVCTVSVQTMDMVDSMAYWEGDRLIAVGDRDNGNWPSSVLVGRPARRPGQGEKYGAGPVEPGQD